MHGSDCHMNIWLGLLQSRPVNLGALNDTRGLTKGQTEQLHGKEVAVMFGVGTRLEEAILGWMFLVFWSCFWC